jgi:hypothetical protein
MLTRHDEQLWHQTADVIAHVETSDPRFYDRHWIAVYDIEREVALQATLGVYPNMNVADAALAVISGGRQYNVRASRSLRPEYEMTVGPFDVEIVEPFRHLRFTLTEGDNPVSAVLDWTTHLPVEEEPHHFERKRGRAIQSWHRYDQVGECSGWVTLPDRYVEVRGAWAGRDHSWGVRPGMGVVEPITGADDMHYAQFGEAASDPTRSMNILPKDRFVFLHFFLTTNHLAGHLVGFFEDERMVRFKGKLHDPARPDDVQLEVASSSLAARFAPGTRRFERVVATLTLTDGRVVTIDEHAVGPSIAIAGLGYSGGFRDGRGLGVWRGDSHLEWDVWDVSRPEEVVYEDGSVRRPLHRLQPVRIAVTGGGMDGQGTGSTTFVFGGDLPSIIEQL